ncbi:MAG TPA: iron chelate uptake ABC transporter family permease subunit [Pseudolysinimonas sp.]|nr:iron chelate uptake ABC transporter family permease subunit [Pseudolysinimonas sp.]
MKIVVALIGLVVIVFASLMLGTRPIAPSTVIEALVSPIAGNHDHLVVRELRVPRTLIGLLAGSALGLAGALMQGVTRNPLADPGLLGINAGAAFFVVLGITWFSVGSIAGLAGFALLGAAAATALVYGVSALGRDGATPVKLALAGAAITAAVTSLTTLVLLSDLDTLSRFRFWTVGSLTGRDLGNSVPLLIPLALGLVLALVTGPALNALALGDDLARGLGHRVALTRIIAGISVLLLCGCATALAGPVVFAGLAAPHIARRLVGGDYRRILPLSAVLGPALLLVADIVGRLIGGTGEIEAGLVIAVLGAPLLIALIRRSRVVSL